MRQFLTKTALALPLAAAGVYFRELLLPLAALVAVMLSDYVTGMLSAWATRTLSSRVGLRGLAKKLGYIFGVGVAVVVDLIVQSAGARFGAELGGCYAFALLVTVWLILNECISILENLTELGVPVPGFLKAVVQRLKQSAERAGESSAPLPPPLGEVPPEGAERAAGEPSQAALAGCQLSQRESQDPATACHCEAPSGPWQSASPCEEETDSRAGAAAPTRNDGEGNADAADPTAPDAPTPDPVGRGLAPGDPTAPDDPTPNAVGRRLAPGGPTAPDDPTPNPVGRGLAPGGPTAPDAPTPDAVGRGLAPGDPTAPDDPTPDAVGRGLAPAAETIADDEMSAGASPGPTKDAAAPWEGA